MRKFEKEFYAGSMMRVTIETSGRRYDKPTKTSIIIKDLGGFNIESETTEDSISLTFEGHSGIQNLINGMRFMANSLEKVLEDS